MSDISVTLAKHLTQRRWPLPSDIAEGVQNSGATAEETGTTRTDNQKFRNRVFAVVGRASDIDAFTATQQALIDEFAEPVTMRALTSFRRKL